MKSPLMHSTVRRAFESEYPPEYICNELEQITSSIANSKISFSESNNDTRSFIFDRGDIMIEGDIHRWQGTASQIEFIAEVRVPESSKRVRYAKISIAPAIFSIIYWYYTGRLIVQNDAPISVVVMSALLFLAFWIGVCFALSWIAVSIFWKDRNLEKRWRVQQEMATIIDKIYQLHTPSAE